MIFKRLIYFAFKCHSNNFRQKRLLRLPLPLSDISQLCRASKRFNEVICNNEYFWRLKFIKDYGSWKYLHTNWTNVYSFGENEKVQHFKAKEISCGSDYTMLIDLNDNLWLIGKLLGIYDTDRLTYITDSILQVACGYNHLVMLNMQITYWF